MMVCTTGCMTASDMDTVVTEGIRIPGVRIAVEEGVLAEVVAAVDGGFGR